MQIEVTELEPCKLSVRYEANALEIMDKRAEVQTYFKKAPVPGFREGKATPEAINLHYRNQIDESLKRALAEDAFHNSLFEKKLRAHGAPRFTNVMLDGGKFICEFEMYTKPEVDLPDWKSWEIPKPHEEMNATAVTEAMLQDFRVRLGDAVPFDENDFVQLGDSVIIDYEGFIDGEKVDALCAEGEMVTVGKEELKGFDDNLLGMKMGETKEFDFNAPEGILPSMAGKMIHFKVTLNMGSKVTPCPLDDELARRMGKETLAEIREMMAARAFAKVESGNRAKLNEAIATRLVDFVTVDVPNWMSLSEAQYLAFQSQLDWNKTPDEDKEKFLDMATRNVRLTLVLDKIRENDPEAQLTDQEVFEIIKKNLAQTKVQNSIDEVIQQMNKTGQLQILFQRIRDEHTLDYIMKNVKVIE